MHIYNFGNANSAYGHGRTGVGNAINAYGRSGGIGAGAAHLRNRGAAGQVSGDLISLVKRDANNEPAATYEASPKTYANQAPAGSFEEWSRANKINHVEERVMRTSSGVANAERINNAILPITMSSEDAAVAGQSIDKIFDSIYEKIGYDGNKHRKSPLVMYMEFNDPAINDGMPKETAVMLLKFCENAEYLSDQLMGAGQRGQTTMYPKTDTLLSPSDAIELAKSIKQDVEKMRAVLDKCGITKESVKDADVIKQTYYADGQWLTPEEIDQLRGGGFRSGFDTRVEDAVQDLARTYGLYRFNEGPYPGTSADTYKGVVAKMTAYL